MDRPKFFSKLFVILFCFAIMRAAPVWSASWEACFDDAGAHYGISPLLLKAIAYQESSMRPDAFNQNRDKASSVDVGLMQINSAHHIQLEDDFSLSLDQIKQPCQNIILGAWVLAHCIHVFGNNWEAVGCYNAGTARTEKQRTRRAHYANKILAIYDQLAAAERMQPHAGGDP